MDSVFFALRSKVAIGIRWETKRVFFADKIGFTAHVIGVGIMIVGIGNRTWAEYTVVKSSCKITRMVVVFL